ncbi:GerW family sporulation protein [Natronincola ferrireducens]|uniref:Sporulation protein YtfJ n=1 Tax=Natronincola ferrireducens TaxID=393762 RepID=A0A1G9CDQ6_9FIRM|nr:GerW family sporulation protein [Natronincola ferrireducens]SDK49801.1 sporulation protein YtfJ [Natronincola ferrireducens]
MSEHPIEALMKTTMESIKEMVDVNTIVGDAVETPDGTVIIPISKVSFGFASGGGDYVNRDSSDNQSQEDENNKYDKEKFPFAGGAGAGVSVQPVAFMVVGNGHIKLMPVDQRANMIDNLITTAPKVVQSIQSMFSNKEKSDGGANNIITYE